MSAVMRGIHGYMALCQLGMLVGFMILNSGMISLLYVHWEMASPFARCLVIGWLVLSVGFCIFLRGGVRHDARVALRPLLLSWWRSRLGTRFRSFRGMFSRLRR